MNLKKANLGQLLFLAQNVTEYRMAAIAELEVRKHGYLRNMQEEAQSNK